MRAADTTLAAVDAALDQGRVTAHELRDLQELALALRADAPRPSEDFARRLDERAAAGFERRRLPTISPRLLGSAVAAAVAAIVAVSLTGHGGGEGGAPHEAIKAPAAVSGAAPAPHIPTGRRHVERSASLTLAAPRNRIDSVGNEVVAVVDRHGGFVLRSSVTSGSSGYFDLRIPSSQLRPAVRDLSALADVRSRSQSLTDITQPYNATADRLAAERALRQSLLNRLAHATTDSEARALRSRLRLVSAHIRALSRQFDSLRQRASYASVEVSVVRKRSHPSTTTNGIGGDFHDALRSLVVSFGIALRVLGVAVPLAIVAGLGWLAATAIRRRRREAALS
jgi:Domain of unknown function (DUF4349)